LQGRWTVDCRTLHYLQILVRIVKVLKKDYKEKIKNVGFRVRILSEDKKISKAQYNDIALESIKVEAIK